MIDFTRLDQMIIDQKALIASQVDVSEADVEHGQAMCDKLFESAGNYEPLVESAGGVEAFTMAMAAAAKPSNITTLAGYEEVRHNTQLMEVTGKFIAVGPDESLVSPSGFHYSDGVFVQTTIAVQANSMAAIKDKINFKCKVFDMSKV